MGNRLGNREEGFTILEVITVCIVLGVLAGIAFPMFVGHRRSAIEATLVSDVRNAAMEMEKKAIFSTTGYAPDLPETFYHTNDNVIVIDATRSDERHYCIIGSHPEFNDMYFYYHSDHRRVTRDMSTCGFKPVKSFASYYADSSYVKAPAPEGYDDPNLRKYKICHNGGNRIELPLPAIVEGHSDHSETMRGKSDTHSIDIIPFIPGKYPGQNWTMAAASIWVNDCKDMDNIKYMPPHPSSHSNSG